MGRIQVPAGLCCTPLTGAPLDPEAAEGRARVLSAVAGTGGKRGRWTWSSEVPDRMAEVRAALGG